MLWFKTNITDGELHIISSKGYEYNCSDRADMDLLCSVLNDEICYLNETGADAEIVLSKIESLINEYKGKVIR